jgi:hypothetical protein
MALQPCLCDYCCYPLIVSSVWRWPLERDSFRMPRFYAFPRDALQCGQDHRGFVPIPSGWIQGPKRFHSGKFLAGGGWVAWPHASRDFFEADEMQHALRKIGLTRMQTDAFMLVERMGFTQTKTAAMLGITQGAVSLRLSGARDRLNRYRKRNLIVLVPVSPIVGRASSLPEAI